MLKWLKKEGEDELERPDPFLKDEIKIFAVTWNLAGKTPNDSHITDLLHSRDAHHDIYVVGS